GGSFENRIRLLLEVAQAVRGVWPEELPLLVRLSATDWVEDGWNSDETVELARRLKALGVDLIDVSSGGTAANAEIPVGPGYQTQFAERVRREAGIATGTVGMITEAVQAEHILRTGQADLILLAREQDQVGLAGAQDVLGLHGLGDHAHGAGGNAGFTAHALGELRLVTRPDGDLGVGGGATGRHIDQIHPERLQAARQFDGFVAVPTILDPVGRRQPHKQRQFFRPYTPHRLGNFQQQTDAVLERAA